MAGDPADVGCAPVHVVMVMIKNVLEGQRCVEQIPSNRVEDTLYRAEGTEQEDDWSGQQTAKFWQAGHACRLFTVFDALNTEFCVIIHTIIQQQCLRRTDSFL